MLRLTQWLIWRGPRSPTGEVIVFLASLLGLRFVFRAGLDLLCGYFSFSEPLTAQILESNEVAVQCLSWAGAAALLRFSQQRPLWRDWGLPSVWQFWNAFPNPFFAGFLTASAGVLCSVFVGFSQVEAPAGGVAGWLMSLPGVLLGALLWVSWFLVLENIRSILAQRLTVDRQNEHLGLLLLIAVESFLIFSVFNSSAAITEQALIAAFSLWAASSLVLAQQSSKRPRSSWRRVGFLAGLLVTLVHVYGLPVAHMRRASLLYLFPGELPQPTGVLAEQGFLGQIVFVGLLWLVGNALLQKALRQKRTI